MSSNLAWKRCFLMPLPREFSLRKYTQSESTISRMLRLDLTNSSKKKSNSSYVPRVRLSPLVKDRVAFQLVET